MHLLDCLTPLFLDLCSVLPDGFCFFISPFWLPFCVCFYILSKALKFPGLISVDLCSRYPVAQSWERFSFRPSLTPACAPPGPPVMIQAIHRCCPYSCLEKPHQKLRPAATSVSLGSAQQGTPDSLSTHLDVVWLGLWVRGGRVSGYPLGRETSVI